MITKLAAAKTAAKEGVDMVLANGNEPSILLRILDGEEIGTLFLGEKGANKNE
jgi:glutamate 5-kinase